MDNVNIKMQRHNCDTRKHKRDLFFHPIEYCLGPRSSGVIFDGSIINISGSGMAMYSTRRLEEGDDIEIMTTLPVPYQKATARWVVEYSQDFYKIGLAFIG